MSISWLLCLVTEIKLFHYMLRGTFISEDKRGMIMLCVEKPGIFFQICNFNENINETLWEM